jgi:DNA topoisomerase IB
MFRTFVGAVLRTGRGKKKGKKGKRSSVVDEGASYDGDGRPLQEVLEAIITRRLRKLEGLRAYLRSHMKAFRLSGGTRSAFYVASTTDTASTLRSPVTRLNTQQSFLVGRSCDR